MDAVQLIISGRNGGIIGNVADVSLEIEKIALFDEKGDILR